MDLLYVHLLLNHVPVIGTIVCALFLLAALIKRSRDLAVAGLTGLVVVALVALPVFYTGEPAEERAERLPGVTDASIHEHEEAAEPAIIVMEVAGALALVGLIAFRVRPAHSWKLVIGTLGVAFIAFVLIARTAQLGGEIRHTELRGDIAGAAASAESEDD